MRIRLGMTVLATALSIACNEESTQPSRQSAEASAPSPDDLSPEQAGSPQQGDAEKRAAIMRKFGWSEEQFEKDARMLRELDTMVQEVRLASEIERNRCLNVFGHEAFCACIAGEYPVAIGLFGYIQATAMTESEFREASLPDDERRWFAKARAGRDKCVASVIKGRPRGSDSDRLSN